MAMGPRRSRQARRRKPQTRRLSPPTRPPSAGRRCQLLSGKFRRNCSRSGPLTRRERAPLLRTRGLPPRCARPTCQWAAPTRHSAESAKSRRRALRASPRHAQATRRCCLQPSPGPPGGRASAPSTQLDDFASRTAVSRSASSPRPRAPPPAPTPPVRTIRPAACLGRRVRYARVPLPAVRPPRGRPEAPRVRPDHSRRRPLRVVMVPRQPHRPSHSCWA